MPKAAQPGASSTRRSISRFWKNPPSWTIFVLAFAAIWLAHWPLLRLPYYWDEAGYYIPAAFDFFRTGSLIPYSTLSNAHPPLPSIYLAGFWKLFGFSPFVTRSAMCAVAALGLAAVWRIALAITERRSLALATVVLTAAYPVFFAQSSLAHADMFAAAATLWALVFYLDRRIGLAVVCFSFAALSKETAIITPLALAGWQIWVAFRYRVPKTARRAAPLLIPALPLALWYAYHWHRTGFIFGNPEYLDYNATATLSPLRIAVAFLHRAFQLTLHMNLFVPVLIALACLLLDRIPENSGLRLSREHRDLLLVVILVNAVFFSVLGGALLTRYLLPLYPLILLLCVVALYARLRRWTWVVAFSTVAFLAALFVNPPYRFAPEDNLAYRDMVRLQQDAIAQITDRYSGETVLTAWPASDELTKPELGYVSRPVRVATIENFSLVQIWQVAHSQKPYSVALIFSTKYNPPRWTLSLGRINQRLDARYFGFHRDLDPALITRLLGGRVVWSEQRRGQWAAVLHFDRPAAVEAQLRRP